MYVQGREHSIGVEMIAEDDDRPKNKKEEWKHMRGGRTSVGTERCTGIKQGSSPSPRAYYERHVGQFLKCDARCDVM